MNRKNKQKSKKKRTIIAGGIILLALAAGSSNNKEVEEIEISISNYQNEYDINTEIPVEISILPTDADTSSVEYISTSDELIFSSTGIVTGMKEGTYEVYVTSGDIASNTLSIHVVDINARDEAATKAEEDLLATKQAAEETETQPNKELEDQNQTEEQILNEEEPVFKGEEQITKEEKIQEPAEVQEAQIATEEQVSQEANLQNEDDTTSATSNNGSNFNTYDNESQQKTEDTYVLNTSRMKIHHPSCGSVKQIAPQNYATSSSSIDELKSQGYSTCGNCFR